MERKKYPLLILLGIIAMMLSNPTDTAGNSNRQLIYQCYISGKLEGWRPVIRKLENKPEKTTDEKLELLNYYYGFTGYLIGQDKEDEAERMIEKADRLCENILKTSDHDATVYAYMGSFLGFRIGMNKFKALSLGPDSAEYIDKSIKLDPNNIQGYLEKGNASYHIPRALGGSKEEAILYYRKAIGIMEADQNTRDNWLYLNALTFLAQAYDKSGKPSLAEATYKKILQIEPEFVYVRDELYPAFRKKR